MADMALMNAEIDCEQLSLYRSGELTDVEAYELGIIDEYGAEIQSPALKDLLPL